MIRKMVLMVDRVVCADIPTMDIEPIKKAAYRAAGLREGLDTIEVQVVVDPYMKRGAWKLIDMGYL